MNSETWKPIRGYDHYLVSNKGRVKLLKEGKETIMSAPLNYNGYPVISLRGAGKRKQFRVSRLVLDAFVGICPEGHEANHINGIKQDNRAENLEWTTPSGNTRHAYANGLAHGPAGETNGRGRLKLSQVTRIREMSGSVSVSEIACMFDISCSHVYAIINGNKWKNASK
jgi:hypothetical protein